MSVNTEMIPDNLEILESFLVANSKVHRYLPGTIMCAISGGADSDILLDLISKVDDRNGVKYVFFDTGLEYVATKEHLEYLEEKYSITIERVKAVKPIPIACRRYGQPFLSKRVSNMIKRLQTNNFKWEDEDFDTLYKKYPKCKVALKWWCNAWEKSKKGYDSQFNISNNKWLKEFMVANPPPFFISDECCEWGKKKTSL